MSHDAANRTLTLRLEGSGGLRYDRAMNALRVVLCRSKSPDEFIWAFSVNVDALMQGDVLTVILPPHVEETFDAFTQKLFVNLLRV